MLATNTTLTFAASQFCVHCCLYAHTEFKIEFSLVSHYLLMILYLSTIGMCTCRHMCWASAFIGFIVLLMALFFAGYVVFKIASHSAEVARDSFSLEATDCLPSQYLINHFVGREIETKDILAALDYQTVEVGILNIYGSPGFGKSTLATYIGHQMLEKDVIIIHINLRETSTDDIEHLLAERVFECVSSSIDKVTFKKMLQFLKKLRRLVLIILDNCDDVLHYQKRNFQLALQNIIMTSKMIKILITSREVTL